MIGRMLGQYRIESKLGEGGMGEVYKARDTRLNRFAAIKILHGERTADPERQRRFLQEAQTASSLNHPNIVHIYDIDRFSDTDYIAMEYVPGKTLDQVTGKSGLPVKQAVGYAVQIADALAAAHAAGIIHRDIKPGNVMVSESGAIKVLDFGLAKLAERLDSGTGGSTITMAPKTREGALVGTIAYMSPEQAEGKKIDARSDIFSFGLLLYEMLGGGRAFGGESTLAILSAILREEPPPLSRTKKGIPRDLERIVQRCLRKQPGRRFQVMEDVKLALEEVEDDVPTIQARPRRRMLLALAALATAVIASVATLALSPARSGEPVYTFTPLATEPEDETWPSWSPDSKALAYVAPVNGVDQVFVRAIGSATSTQITKSSSDCRFPFWHPDGTRIFYNSNGGLWSVRGTGGQPVLVFKDVRGGSISPDGTVVAFVRGVDTKFNLWTVPLNGGTPRQYRETPFPAEFREVDLTSQAQFSPDGSKIGVSLSVLQGGFGDEFWIVPYPSGKPRRAFTHQAIQRFSWLPDNNRVVFDAGRPEVGRHLLLGRIDTGTVTPILSGTGQEGQAAVSPDGTRVAFASGGIDFDLIEVPLDGGPPRNLLATARSEQTPQWAPSGSQYVYSTDANGTVELWLRSVAERWSQPVVSRTTEGLADFPFVNRPVFSPDGQSLAFAAMGKIHAIWITTLAGGRPMRLETESSDQHGASWSPDGDWISYWRLHNGAWSVLKTAVGGGSSVELVTGMFWGPIAMIPETAWAPSGKWICYNGPEGLYLVSPDGARRKTLTKTISDSIAFSKDSSTVYALRRAANGKWQLVSVDVQSAQERKIVPVDFADGATLAGLTIHPDGRRFATSVGRARHDIWLMEGFHPR